MTWNIGHRGAAGLEPENTLRSFRRAEEEGVDALELDLRVTRDGHLVVLHDATVARTTDGSGLVEGMTLAELRQLDAGKGERVPILSEVLKSTQLPIHAELKVPEAANLLAETIRERNLELVTPISFLPDALRQLKDVLPDQPVGLILLGAPPDAAERARTLGAEIVSLEAVHLTSELVEDCQRAGLRVTTWTVNERDSLHEAMELGVDGIATDRPDLLADVLKSLAA
jgi:glycerophosphoryl diester phosphodiesterase